MQIQIPTKIIVKRIKINRLMQIRINKSEEIRKSCEKKFDQQFTMNSRNDTKVDNPVFKGVNYHQLRQSMMDSSKNKEFVKESPMSRRLIDSSVLELESR